MFPLDIILYINIIECGHGDRMHGCRIIGGYMNKRPILLIFTVMFVAIGVIGAAPRVVLLEEAYWSG